MWVQQTSYFLYLIPTCLLKYTICDATLLFQIYYYRWKRSRPIFHSPNLQDRETDPLLVDGDEITEEVLPLGVLALRYSTALVFVVAVGLMAWWITYDDEGTDLTQPALDSTKWWLIQVFGWTSALLFVCLHNLDFFSLLNSRHSWVHESLKFVRFPLPWEGLPHIWNSEKFPYTLRRVITRSFLFRDIWQYHIRLVDLCKEHG